MPDVLRFQYMFRDEVMADVEVDYEKPFSIKVKNYTEDNLYKPFGIRDNPTMEDFDDFLVSRCFPKERRNCKQLLKDLGLINYSPYLIVRKTHGRQLEDYLWIKFEGETVDYEKDIKLRD